MIFHSLDSVSKTVLVMININKAESEFQWEKKGI